MNAHSYKALEERDAEIARLREALKPFADVIDALSRTQELDRSVEIEAFPTIHFRGCGASGGCGIKPEAFRAAYAAMRARL